MKMNKTLTITFYQLEVHIFLYDVKLSNIRSRHGTLRIKLLQFRLKVVKSSLIKWICKIPVALEEKASKDNCSICMFLAQY